MSGGGTPSKPAPTHRRAALSATSGGSTASGTADAQRAERKITLMTEIRQLGRLPRKTKACREDESRLAHRLHDAKGKGHLSESQLVELAEMPASDLREERAAAMMAEIRALGRVPKMTERQPAENKLAHRLRDAKRYNRLSETQLAELAEMPDNRRVMQRLAR